MLGLLGAVKVGANCGFHQTLEILYVFSSELNSTHF